MDSRMHDTREDEEKRIQPPQPQQHQPLQSLASPEIDRQLALLHGVPQTAAPAAAAARAPIGAPPHAFLTGAPAAPADPAAAGSGGPPISPHRAGGRALYDASAPKYSSASTFEWTDDLSAQLTLQRMFADCIDRIRMHNEKLEQMQKSIPDDELMILRSLFGHSDLVKMLRIAEKPVTVCIGESSSRYFFRVDSSDKNAPKYCTTPFHCNCLAFTNQVVIANTHLYCKHQVGAQLAEAIGNVKIFKMSESSLARELTQVQPAKQGWGGRGRWSGGGGGGGGHHQQHAHQPHQPQQQHVAMHDEHNFSS